MNNKTPMNKNQKLQAELMKNKTPKQPEWCKTGCEKCKYNCACGVSFLCPCHQPVSEENPRQDWRDFKIEEYLQCDVSVDSKKLKDFIASLITQTEQRVREELAEMIKATKTDERKVATFGEWQADSYGAKMLVNAVLDHILTQLKNRNEYDKNSL